MSLEYRDLGNAETYNHQQIIYLIGDPGLKFDSIEAAEEVYKVLTEIYEETVAEIKNLDTVRLDPLKKSEAEEIADMLSRGKNGSEIEEALET